MKSYELFPDPKDRTPDNPHILVEAKNVINLFNLSRYQDADSLTDEIKEWFEEEATVQGWSKGTWVGNEINSCAVLKRIW